MIELPTKRSTPKSYNPSLIVLFGKPKSGKSTLMASLDDNLIIDFEDGYRALSVMAVQARSVADLVEIANAIKVKTKELGKQPYKYITLDNATRIEEICLGYARQLYQKTPMGASWGKKKDPATGKLVDDPTADVRMLPNGSGYTYIRMAVKKVLDLYKGLSETLILVAHVKDKMINRNGTEMSEMAVDLAGKLGDIICGEADAIGLIYREKNNTIISFEGGDNTIKEARPLHLRGKKFIVATSDEDNNITVDMSKIFLDGNN